MWAIFRKEINVFFSSPTGYVVIGVFLVFLGLMMWVFPDYSVLEYRYATLNQLFEIAPMIFLFLVPAICMRSFSEEKQTGTIETLLTKPLSEWHIVFGKYLGALFLILMALLPTLIYVYSIWTLGSPPGNIDTGEVLGSYIGLFLLAAIFASISQFTSVQSNNQIVAFLVASFLCFIIYWGFQFVSSVPAFVGTWDDTIQKLGIDYHYRSISRGAIDTRDLLYFFSVIFLFLYLTYFALVQKKNFGNL